MILYHGTTKKFDHFDLAHLGTGEGKSKFGVGHYASSVYDTAALYAGKCKGRTKYVYTLDVPELTDANHIVSTIPPHKTIIEKAEEHVGKIPDEAKSSGKSFRKYIGNFIIGNKGTVKKMIGSLSIEGEIEVSKFLYKIGVLYLVWAQSQSRPDNGQINVAMSLCILLPLAPLNPRLLRSSFSEVIGSAIFSLMSRLQPWERRSSTLPGSA